MKQLIIMRHGKSDWDDYEMDDFDRSLTKRGMENASQMGQFILQKCGVPYQFISSSAKRAFDTAVIVADSMKFPVSSIIKEDKFYLASYSTIFQLIKKTDDSVLDLILFGHNPGLTELINHLGVELDNLPTASCVCFQFDVENWNAINKSNACFKWIQLARNL